MERSGDESLGLARLASVRVSHLHVLCLNAPPLRFSFGSEKRMRWRVASQAKNDLLSSNASNCQRRKQYSARIDARSGWHSHSKPGLDLRPAGLDTSKDCASAT
eukprot:scaffold150201_cov18-Prasinocladus_malaysianus.AAC.1